MRIAIVGPAHPYRGGIAHFGVRLARQLSLRHEIRYINFTRLYPNILFPGKTQYDQSDEQMEFSSERLLDSILPHTWYRTGRELRRWRADVILFHWWHPFFGPCYRGVLSAMGRKPLRLTICHNVLPHESSATQRYMVKYGLNRMDGLVIHANSEDDIVNTILPDKPRTTLFHPIYDIFTGERTPRDEARRSLGIPIDAKMVLYFGLIRPYKGVDVLLDAIDKIKDIDGIKVFIVGEIYSNREELLMKAEQYGHIVTIVDNYIPNEQVTAWFRAADLIALPYLSATQSGIVPIAYRCRRPVVVTRVGGLPDIVVDGESGYLVEPGDPDDLAKAIRLHFTDSDPEAMKGGVDRICKRLSWESYVEQLETFVDRLRNREIE